MNWIRHETNLRNTPEITLLISRMGLEGYGRYLSVLETVAGCQAWGNECSASYPVEFWKKDLKASRKKLGRFVKVCEEIGLLYGAFHDKPLEMLEIYVPSLISNRSLRPCPTVWKVIRIRIFERDDFTCQYCGVRGVDLECDHVLPVSRGGSSDDDNLVTACKPCNRSKRAKTPAEWLP